MAVMALFFSFSPGALIKQKGKKNMEHNTEFIILSLLSKNFVEHPTEVNNISLPGIPGA